MPTPSPYGPDRSLLVASAVLVGLLALVAAGLYLLTSLSTGVSEWSADPRAVASSHGGAWRATQQRTGRAMPPSTARRRNARVPPPAGGEVPAWAGEGSAWSAPAVPGGGYDLRADLGYADLSTGTTTGASGPVSAGASGRSRPSVGQAPLAVDVGRSSTSQGVSRTGESGGSWRPELSQLGGRLRALDGAIAALDRSGGRSANGSGTSSGAETSSQPSTAGARTSARNVPSAPNPVPVDGGLGWLAAAGAAYAARRLQKRSQASDADEA